MTTYAITGISGYLGQKLYTHLERLKTCERIIGIDLKEPSWHGRKFEFYRMDIRDDEMESIFKQEKVNVLIHLAFVTNPIRDHKKMYDIDVNGTRNVFQAAKSSSLRQVLVISSTSVYGAWKDNPKVLCEDSPLRGNPDYQYAYDKVRLEEICQEFMQKNKKIVFNVLRLCMVLGPHAKNFISRGLQHTRFVPLIGGVNPPMQFIHEDDVVQACKIVLEKRVSGVFNIVGRDTITLKEIGKLLGKPTRVIPRLVLSTFLELVWKWNLLERSIPPGMIHFFQYPWIASGAKAEKELGFVPRHSSKDAVLKLFQRKKLLE